jgi:hypothetical protein
MKKSIVTTFTPALTAIGAATAAIPGLVPIPMEVTESQGNPFQIGAKLEIGYTTSQPASGIKRFRVTVTGPRNHSLSVESFVTNVPGG